ncbi:MAG: hypothetical protein PHH83_03310 [Patescibacteria group bacterium]|nr:hypothetical protein [Patescibacteria group bacterium]
MIINIILIILVVISIGVIGSIIIKKLPQLKRLDIDSIDSRRENKIKNQILKKKFKRDLGLLKNNFSSKLKPFFEKLKNSSKKLKVKILRIEKKYREKLAKVHFDDKISKEIKINEHIENAENFIKEKDWINAENEYIEALKIDIHNANTYIKLADLYFTKKDYEKAKQTYEYAIKLQENDYIYNKLGEISSEMGDLNTAAINYSKSISLTANNPIYYLNLAKINLKLEQYENSLHNINRSLNLEPENPKFLDFLLDLSIIMKDKNLAEKTIGKLIEVNPENNSIPEYRDRINKI